ncbi:MAG: NUDIX domain-containing protein [Pseudomonadota bacterium]
MRDLSPEAVARLVYFEGAFAFDLKPVRVETGAGNLEAEIFWPQQSVQLAEDAWRLEDWQAEAKPIFLGMAQDIMSVYPEGGTKGEAVLRSGALRRTVARRRAAEMPAPSHLRSGFGAEAVREVRNTRNHVGFFSAETISFRFQRFDGSFSERVEREVFVTGDAVSVLPWDPKRDLVLLIEQVRAGAIMRGDPNPWGLEAIAGLLDRDESAEEAARREAEEEAGLTLGRMEEVGRYYSSPGALTEHMTSFLAEADLGSAGGIHGLASEAEDIRNMVVPFEAAVATLDTGEAGNGPLVISLMALSLRRERLLREWG